MSHKYRNKYVDMKINGRLFPSWILANFKKYKLPDIVRDDTDPCAKKTKEELRSYQKYLSDFMDYNSPYHDILIYHGLGSGKTVSAINIYNMLYNYTPGWNVFILIKATLKNHPWMKDLEHWLSPEEKNFRFENIRFISYDAPNADKAFLDAVKNADSSKKSLYIIDEAHNFIRNVYTNISTRQGKRAQTIYDYMIQDKKENDGVRIILLSATPAINSPYELALVFNLLRPGSFPKSEAQFNQYYVSSSGYETLNDAKKNNFQRRILGLVSYYIGATPDFFATKTVNYVDVEMSDYQSDIYGYYEEIEEKIARRKRGKGGSTTYKSYTRQSCNFVFPSMAQGMMGETRPRPKNFKISEKEGQNLDKGRFVADKDKTEKYYNVQNYIDMVDKFANTFDDYLHEKFTVDKKEGYTLLDDIKKFHQVYRGDYAELVKTEKKKSHVFEAMYECSSKMLQIIFNIMRSPGPVLVYSNYVLMEGLQIFKTYLKYFGFSQYKDKDSGVDDFRYMEYHGGIDAAQRSLNIETFNNSENKYGKIGKIMLISPAGAEGISLYNIRQVHIMEPYWHETRIVQMIGRAIRMCSHKDLLKSERHVDIYRYKSVRKAGAKWTADQQIEDLARGKEGLIQSFLDAVREAAVDCVLNKGHNSLIQDYKCFQFEEPSLFDDQIGPAYKEDLVDDFRIDNGSNSMSATTLRIKVMKITAVKQLTKGDEHVKYSKELPYWYNPDTGTVYDYDLHYAIGKVSVDDDGLPVKMSKDVYIIDKVIPIPHIDDE
jgi:superfamily II DNA or RNA helicase